MQLTTDELERGDTQQAAPKSPGSPFSAKQRRWSGIVQQVQDSSARLNLRRRQSTETAAAAAGGPAHYGLLQGAAHADAAAGARGSARSSVLQDKPTAGLHASSAGQPAAAGHYVPISSPTNPLLPPSKAVGEPSRWTSLKQRLREVKHGRQNCSSSRASSTIADSSDASSVVSEGSSVVEVKLERLLLQVATKPCAAAGCTSAEKRPAPSCPVRGLGVTVRRFTPPTASTTSRTPDTLQAPIHHAASSPALSTAATSVPPAAAAAAAATAAVMPSSQLSPLEHIGSSALQPTEAAAVQLKHTPSEPLPQQQQQQQQQQPQLQQLQGVPGLLPAELGSPAPAVSLQQQQPAVQPSLLVSSSSSVPALAAAAVATSAGVSGSASWLAAPTAAAAALVHCAGDTACTAQEARVPLWLSPAGAAAAAKAGAEPQAAHTAPAAADAAAGTYTGGSQAGFGSCMPGMLNKRPTLLLTELHAAVGVSDIAPPPAAPAAAAPGEARAAQVSAGHYGMDRSGLSCTLLASTPEVTGLQDSTAGHSMPCRKPPSLLLPGQQVASGGACDCAAPAVAGEAGPGSSCRRPSLVLSQQQQQQAHAAGQDPAGLCSSSPPGSSSDGSAVQIHSYSTGACVGDSTTAVPSGVAGGSCQGAVLHSSLSTSISAGGLTQLSGYNPTSRPLGPQVLQHDGLLAPHPQHQQQQQRQHSLPPCSSNSGAAPCAAGGAGPAAEAVVAASAAASTLLQGSHAQPTTSQLLSGRPPLYCSYSSAADVFNNADIQQLLHRVEACMGPTHSAVTAAAVAAADAAAAASAAFDYPSRPAEQAAALLSDRGHTSTRAPQQQQQQQQQSLLSEHVEATFDSSSGSNTGCKPRLASSDGHLAPSGSSSRSISSMPKRLSILLRSTARAGGAEAEPGQLQQVLGSNPVASSPASKSTGCRLLQRHVSWKAEVDVLLGDDAAPQRLNDPAKQEGATSGVSVHQEHRHGQGLQRLSSFTQQSDVASQPAVEHRPAGAAYTRNSLAGAAAAAPSSAAACAGEVGDAVLANRASPDAAGSSSWRPRLGSSSWDGAVVRSRSVAAAAAAAAAGAPSATLVVPLSSAALALAADLEHQQQQQQRRGVVTEPAGCEITLSGASGFASGQLQHLPARQSVSSGGGQVQRVVAAAEGFKTAVFKAVATAGIADDGVSCCGSSELSAMGNPLAYADRLKQRMEQHLDGNLSSRSRSMSGSGLGAAAGGAEEEERATAAAPLAGVTLLEQYLDEHQVLKQKAARLKQNLTQRQQLKEQHHKHSAFAANHTSPLQLRHTFSPLAASQGSNQNRWQGSLGGIRQESTSTASRTLSQSTKPEQLVQGRLYTPDKIRTAPAEDQCGLNVDELRQDLELVLKRV